MKTLHEIKPEPSFLEYMERRWHGQHFDWQYHGDQIWFRRTRTSEPAPLDDYMQRYWYSTYEQWLERGAPPL